MDFSRSLLDQYLTNRIVHVPASEIQFCTAPTSYCDYTQHGADPDHHHAKVDRGVFLEDRTRALLDGEWDSLGPEFNTLPEFVSLKDHFIGNVDWRESEHAERIVAWMTRKKLKPRGLSRHPGRWLDERLAQIEALYASIEKKGVQPKGRQGLADIDDISVNISRRGEVLFNNRGHHRLAICHLLKVDNVPTQIVVMHKLFVAT